MLGLLVCEAAAWLAAIMAAFSWLNSGWSGLQATLFRCLELCAGVVIGTVQGDPQAEDGFKQSRWMTMQLGRSWRAMLQHGWLQLGQLAAARIAGC